MNARSTYSTPGPSAAGAIPEAPASPAATMDVASPYFEEGTLERLTEVVEPTPPVAAAPARPAAPRAPYLVVLTGDHEGQVIRLPSVGQFVIGRAEACDFTLEDDGISRLHARIVVAGSAVFVEDMGSRNGTFIGSQAVKHQRLLGDEIIRVGARTAFKFALMDNMEEEYLRRLLSAALKDPLTTLYNRRHFDERMGNACAGSNRHGEPFSLILADIDNFKRVNDTYGHAVGDVVLRAVADALLGSARREDEVFRHGGEEFALLMRNTTGKGGAELAERIRRVVAQTPIVAEGAALTVTLSLGVAQHRQDDEAAQTFGRADKALYEAKRTTKNCVVVAPFD